MAPQRYLMAIVAVSFVLLVCVANKPASAQTKREKRGAIIGGALGLLTGGGLGGIIKGGVIGGALGAATSEGKAGRHARRSARTGAEIGGGLGLLTGGSLDDALKGAVIGGAAGSIYGAHKH